MCNFKKNTIAALISVALFCSSVLNAFANTPDWGTSVEQPNQIINDGSSTPGENSNVEVPVKGVMGNVYDTNGDGTPDIDVDGNGTPDTKPVFPEGSLSKINVSVPLNMKFAIIGNLVGEEKFISPTYEVINSGLKAINISIVSFQGVGGDFVPVVENTQIVNTNSPDEKIALDLKLGDGSAIALKTSGFLETGLGSVDKNETKELKFVNAKYGKDFSKFKEANDNRNTSYNMTWKITE